MWYVVQVQTGREDAACNLISQAVGDSPALQECFVPRYRTADKQDGKWLPCDKVMFPGYLIIVSNKIEVLEPPLRKLHIFTKVLGNNNVFTPLSDDEIAWIDAYTKKGDRVIPMSVGYVEEGARVVVTEGPLVGREGTIRKINHRKKRAYLHLEMFGRPMDVEMGLRVVRKRPSN